jgi:ABC-type amino acid transport substrate-binding protein
MFERNSVFRAFAGGSMRTARRRSTAAVGALGVFLGLIAGSSAPASADRLDEVVAAGTLRCAVVIDFPPMGFRDAAGEPQGFDVEYCKDLAASLDVGHKILPVTWTERLPAIVDGQADVVFGGTSITLEGARMVGFSIPYAVFYAQAVVRGDSGIVAFDDMRGKRVGAAASTLQETEFLRFAEEWKTTDLYRSLPNEQAVFEALASGEIDAGIVTNTEIPPILEKYSVLKAGPRMPWAPDVTAAIAKRTDISWLNYINLFIVNQVRSGRYGELWSRFIGGDAPNLTVPGVAY